MAEKVEKRQKTNLRLRHLKEKLDAATPATIVKEEGNSYGDGLVVRRAKGKKQKEEEKEEQDDSEDIVAAPEFSQLPESELEVRAQAQEQDAKVYIQFSSDYRSDCSKSYSSLCGKKEKKEDGSEGDEIPVGDD